MESIFHLIYECIITKLVSFVNKNSVSDCFTKMIHSDTL